MDILVDEALAGECIRSVLQKELRLSTKMIKHLKYHPLGITVNGKATTINRMFQVYNLMYTVRQGDTVTVTLFRPSETGPGGEEFEVEVTLLADLGETQN